MPDSKDDEAKFNETLKRMLNSPPQKRQKASPDAPAQRSEDMRVEKGGSAAKRVSRRRNQEP